MVVVRIEFKAKSSKIIIIASNRSILLLIVAKRIVFIEKNLVKEEAMIYEIQIKKQSTGANIIKTVKLIYNLI